MGRGCDPVWLDQDDSGPHPALGSDSGQLRIVDPALSQVQFKFRSSLVLSRRLPSRQDEVVPHRPDCPLRISQAGRHRVLTSGRQQEGGNR